MRFQPLTFPQMGSLCLWQIWQTESMKCGSARMTQIVFSSKNGMSPIVFCLPLLDIVSIQLVVCRHVSKAVVSVFSRIAFLSSLLHSWPTLFLTVLALEPVVVGCGIKGEALSPLSVKMITLTAMTFLAFVAVGSLRLYSYSLRFGLCICLHLGGLSDATFLLSWDSLSAVWAALLGSSLFSPPLDFAMVVRFRLSPLAFVSLSTYRFGLLFLSAF